MRGTHATARPPGIIMAAGAGCACKKCRDIATSCAQRQGRLGAALYGGCVARVRRACLEVQRTHCRSSPLSLVLTTIMALARRLPGEQTTASGVYTAQAKPPVYESEAHACMPRAPRLRANESTCPARPSPRVCGASLARVGRGAWPGGASVDHVVPGEQHAARRGIHPVSAAPTLAT